MKIGLMGPDYPGFRERGAAQDCPGVLLVPAPRSGVIDFQCTLDAGHTGLHCAHQGDGRMVASWSDEEQHKAADEMARRYGVT